MQQMRFFVKQIAGKSGGFLKIKRVKGKKKQKIFRKYGVFLKKNRNTEFFYKNTFLRRKRKEKYRPVRVRFFGLFTDVAERLCFKRKRRKAPFFFLGAAMNKFTFLKFFTKKLLFVAGLPASYFIPAYPFLSRYGIAGFEQVRVGCLHAGAAGGYLNPG